MKFALVVSGDPQSLKYVEKSAEDVSQHLNDYSEFEAEYIPLKSRATLPDYLSTVTKDIDEFIFYFIGHGKINYKDTENFEFEITTMQKDNLDAILTMIKDTINPKKTFIIVDACHSGRILWNSTTKKLQNVFLLASCSSSERSWECSILESTRFSSFFCSSIREAKSHLTFYDIEKTIYKKFEKIKPKEQQTIDKSDLKVIGTTLLKSDIKKEQPPKDQKLFLTIQLHPSEKEYFKITIWAKSDDGTYLKNIAVEDIALHKSKIAQYIDDCIEERYREISSEDIYLIFVMPSDLMTENINAWKLDRDRELGTEYTILMRGLERFSSEGENFHNKLYRLRDWEKNWEHCDTKGKQSLCNVHQIVTSNERVSKIPSKQIARTPFIILKYGVDSHTFITLYQSHISIALWINDCTDYEKFEQLFHKYSTYNLNELLENIDELQPYSSSLKGNAMLLYDNPDDVPPDEIKKRNAKTPKG